MEKLLLILLFFVLLLSSCSSKNNEKSENTLGEYVYVDSMECVHVNKECLVLFIDRYAVKFVRANDLERGFLYCSRCVTDSMYVRIENIIDKKNNRIKLHGLLNEIYDIGSKESFCEDLKDPEKRKSLYDVLCKEGYSDLGSWEEFNEFLGF